MAATFSNLFPKKPSENPKSPVRPPAVAGGFYPADPNILSSTIKKFLDQVEAPKEQGELKILIVPHAGYAYSGQVAAHGFRKLQDKDYSTVIILGGSHQLPFEQAAVYAEGVWKTPLGEVEIDQNLASRLVDLSSQIVADTSIHAQEHSLEVEVPFLQTVLRNFKIVPILLGSDSSRLALGLSEVLAQNFTPQTLLVVSSDLTHYPTYEIAQAVDKRTIDAILTGKVENFEKAISESESAGHSDLLTCACAAGAIKTAMYLAVRIGANKIKLLHYANSGDVSGEKNRVVGYGAVGFYLDESLTTQKFTETVEESELEKEEQKELLELARQTLEEYVKTGSLPQVEVKSEALQQYLGTFVTLRKNGELRGCLGIFEPHKRLWQVVQEHTVASASKDPRFPPVREEELDQIKIEISVLSPRKKISSWKEIELGKHGVFLQKGNRGGVFLPQVATETGWDFETFMGQLCYQKAGLPPDCWKDPDVALYTFTAQIFEEEEFF